MIRVLAVGLCLVTTFSCLGAEAPTAAEPHKVDLFVGQEQGYELYRIPGIVVTSRGTRIVYCEARKAARSDWGKIDVVARRSTDGGQTWTPQEVITHLTKPVPRNPAAVAQNLGKEGETTINNPVMIADRNGTVHLVFCAEYGHCFYQQSVDDGATWTEPADITATFETFRPHYNWLVIATGPGHGIQLQNGRLLIPVWLSLGTGGHAHRPSVTSTIFSDDGGTTWQAGQIAVPNTSEWVNPNETVAVELQDGRVQLNVRSESAPNRRLVVTSPDGATSWSQPQFNDALWEPVCFASLIRLPSEGHPDTLIFSNPYNLDRKSGAAKPGQGRDRVNLTLQLSPDGGRTWTCRRSLEPSSSGYSDLAVSPEGQILCFYERTVKQDGKARPGLTLATISPDWLRSALISATP